MTACATLGFIILFQAKLITCFPGQKDMLCKKGTFPEITVRRVSLQGTMTSLANKKETSVSFT